MGRLFKMVIIGFFVTPYLCVLRIMLLKSNDERQCLAQRSTPIDRENAKVIIGVVVCQHYCYVMLIVVCSMN